MLQPFRLFFVRAAIPMKLLAEPSEPSVCLDGLSPFRQSNTPSPTFDTRKTAPCAAYTHLASLLGRDSATSRGGRLIETMGQAVLSGIVEGMFTAIPAGELIFLYAQVQQCHTVQPFRLF